MTEKKDRRLFCWWFVPAALFTMIVQYATNTGIVTLSVAYGMCSCVGLLFVADWVQEEKRGCSTHSRKLVIAQREQNGLQDDGRRRRSVWRVCFWCSLRGPFSCG